MSYQLVTDGLVAHWDSSTWESGKSWTDSIGGKVITFTSAPTKSDDGLELTTSITFTSEALTSLTNSCTLEWIGRVDGTWANTNPGMLFGWSSSLGNWAGICCYSKTSTNGIQLDITSAAAITSKLYTQGIEYHIVITVSGTTTTFYCNSTEAKGTSTKANGYASKTYLYNNEGSGRFYGAIQRMCLWNKALSADEIATLFTEAPDVDDTVPTITVTTPNKSKISDESGYSQCTCVFSTDYDLSEWEARAVLSNTVPARGVGVLVESGTNLSANSSTTVYVDFDELTSGDGEYTIAIYGKGVNGMWSDGTSES